MYALKTHPGAKITTTTVKCHVCDRFGAYPRRYDGVAAGRKVRAQARAHSAKSGHRTSTKVETQYAALIEPQGTPERDSLGRRLPA